MMLQNLKKFAVNYLLAAAMIVGVVAVAPTSVKAAAVASATIDSATDLTGALNQAFSEDLTLTTDGDGFATVAAGANVLSWFKNLPAGITTAVVKTAITGGSVDGANAVTTMDITISGTPTVAQAPTEINVTVPATAFVTSSAAVTANTDLTATFEVVSTPTTTINVTDGIIEFDRGTLAVPAEEVTFTAADGDGFNVSKLRVGTSVASWFVGLDTAFDSFSAKVLSATTSEVVVAVNGKGKAATPAAVPYTTIVGKDFLVGAVAQVVPAGTTTYEINPLVQATISDETVSGTVTTQISAKKFTITLVDATFDTTKILVGQDITALTNLGDDYNAVVKSIAADAKSLVFEVTGYPYRPVQKALTVKFASADQYVLDTQNPPVALASDLLVDANPRAKINITTASNNNNDSGNNNNRTYSGSDSATGATLGTVAGEETGDKSEPIANPLKVAADKSIEMTVAVEKVKVDGTDVDPKGTAMGEPFQDTAGNVMIPVRLFAESTGCTVTWDAANKAYTITDKDGKSVVIKLGSTYVYDTAGNILATLYDAAGNPVAPYLDTATERSYLPMRALFETVFGFSRDSIAWNQDTKTVTVTIAK